MPGKVGQWSSYNATVFVRSVAEEQCAGIA
jgi:hypothetical protein